MDRYIIAQTEGKATMLLDGVIGAQIIGKDFVNELMFLDSLKLDEITIKVNSAGGNVFEGWEIFSAIEDAETPIHIDVVGMAASMASGLLLAGDRVTARPFSMIMVHAAKFPDKAKAESPEEEKLLGDVNASFIRVMATRSKMNKKEVEALFMGNDNWFTAAEAEKLGLIDEVTPLKAKKKKLAAETDTIIAEVNAILERKGTANEIYATYNNLLNQKSNQMEPVYTVLGLTGESATENGAVKAIEGLVAQIIVVGDKTITLEDYNEVVASNVKLKAEIKAANEVSAEAHKTAIEEKVQAAFKASKINEKSIEMYVEMGIEDEAKLDAVFASFGDVVAHPGSIDAELTDDGKAGKGAKGEYPGIENSATFDKEDRATWSHRDWEKNDEVGLQAIYDVDPEKADKMYKDCYAGINEDQND